MIKSLTKAIRPGESLRRMSNGLILKLRTNILHKTISLPAGSIVVFLVLLSNTEGKMLAQNKLYPNTFPLSQVKLLDGPFKHACDLNTQVLLSYDPDRFLSSFLKEAGLTPKKPAYGNWESSGLDGHIGGHYLSALAITYAATGNQECRTRLVYMLAELKKCQIANGNGYIGGIPNGKPLWTEISKGNTAVIWKYWVPWYNMHKTYAGLRDAWLYGGNEDAKGMFLELCDWGVRLLEGVDDQSMEAMLANEFGGMNEVYADAYAMTGKQEYLQVAKRFSHKRILDSMAKRTDNLDNMHANTQVPKAVGYARVAELTNDSIYKTAARFFWETVVHNRSLSLGGNSRREHFPEAHDCKSYMDEREGPETCNTNNMLKLTEDLFRLQPSAQLADYYERATFNHILSSQHPEHGGYVYFTPARPSHYRVYSAPNSAMWCCVGTGMENHGKYGEFIYTHSNDALYVNLFIASELNWPEKDFNLVQNTTFPYGEASKLTVRVKAPVKLKLLIRYPSWVRNGGMHVTCNGVDYAKSSVPASYVEIDRTWNDGDVVEIQTPMMISIEELPNMPEAISILKGPILLAAKTNSNDMPGLIADDGRWSHIASGPLVSLFDTPFLIGSRDQILSKLNSLQPIDGKPFNYSMSDLFTQEKFKTLTLQPFYQLHDSRYMMYWMSMTEHDFDQYQKARKLAETKKLMLDKRTVDVVKPGEQQPEADHQMKTENSSRGVYQGEAWRNADKNGFFQYTMKTSNEKNLTLMVRVWGNEKSKLKVSIDGLLLIDENLSGKWNKNEFVNIEYRIPSKLLRSKETVTVRCFSDSDQKTASVYQIRLLKN